MKNGFTTASAALLSRISYSLQQHPKRITAALATVLLTGGGGAFAVASLGPDAADLPVRLVEEPVQSLASGSTLADLSDGATFSLYRADNVRNTDTAESLLRRLGIADPAAAAFLRRDSLTQQNLLGRHGRLVRAETTDDHRLLRLVARWAHEDNGMFSRLVVEKNSEGKLVSRLETAPLTVSSRLAGGVIHSSLFAATDDANIPDNEIGRASCRERV